jgi:hypothetical protein
VNPLDFLADLLLQVHQTGLTWREVDLCGGLNPGASWRYSRRRKHTRRSTTARQHTRRTAVVAERVARNLATCGMPKAENIGHAALARLCYIHKT